MCNNCTARYFYLNRKSVYTIAESHLISTNLSSYFCSDITKRTQSAKVNFPNKRKNIYLIA